MAHYLVGVDDSSFFKKRTTWDFMDALEAANDGDVIELEKDYNLIETDELHIIKIDKSITIRGHSHIEDGNTILSNVLPKINVNNNAQVTLDTVILRDNREKTNILNIKGNSTLTLQTVLIENLATEGKNFPIIYASEQSTLNLTGVRISPGTSMENINLIYSHHSTLHITNSYILTKIFAEQTNLYIEDTVIDLERNIAPIEALHSNVSLLSSEMKGSKNILFKDHSTVNVQNSNIFVGVKADHSEITMKDVRVETHTNNAFQGINADVQLEDVYLEGGLLTDDGKYPCAFFRDAKIQLNNVEIIQENYTSALTINSSEGKIDSVHASSVNVFESSIHFQDAFIHESLFIRNKSTVTANRVEVLGRFNGKVNIYMVNHSSFQADEVFIGKESQPNIVLDYTVDYQVGETKLFVFDEETQDFKKDEDNYLFFIDKEVDISYVGEKPALTRLNELIGIHNIKEEVESFIAVAELNKRRMEDGLESTPLSLHSLFLGNPGTGKTSVARLIGEILYEKSIVSNNNFIEVSRADLIAGYVGQTAIKTREILQSALGGVLFIDEAYTLSTGGNNDFGIEAINEILKFMEDHRSDIVIIFAGYTNDMQKFLEMNDGLRSRIPNHFHFPDYSTEELTQIGLIDLYSKNYRVNEDTYGKLIEHQYEGTYDQSNGRWARNLNELITRKMALRIMNDPDADIHTILEDDLLSLMK